MRLSIPLISVKILIDCIKVKYEKIYDPKKFTWIIDSIHDNFLILDVFSNRESKSKNETKRVKNPKSSWMIFFDSTVAARNYMLNSLERGNLDILKIVPLSILLKHSKLKKEAVSDFETYVKSLDRIKEKEVKTLLSDVVLYKDTLFESLMSIDFKNSKSDTSVSSDDSILDLQFKINPRVAHSDIFLDWITSKMVFVIDEVAIESKSGNDRFFVSNFETYLSMFETSFPYLAEEMCANQERFDKLQKHFNSFIGLSENVYDLNTPEIVFKNIPKFQVVKIA